MRARTIVSLALVPVLVATVAAVLVATLAVPRRRAGRGRVSSSSRPTSPPSATTTSNARRRDGYGEFRDAAGITCIRFPGAGGMGTHYVSSGVGDTDVEPATPEALVYETQRSGPSDSSPSSASSSRKPGTRCATPGRRSRAEGQARRGGQPVRHPGVLPSCTHGYGSGTHAGCTTTGIRASAPSSPPEDRKGLDGHVRDPAPRRLAHRRGARRGGRRFTAEGDQMRDEVAGIRSYVTAEPDGRVGTVCVYQASCPRRSAWGDLPSIVKVADTRDRQARPGARRGQPGDPRLRCWLAVAANTGVRPKPDPRFNRPSRATAPRRRASAHRWRRGT